MKGSAKGWTALIGIVVVTAALAALPAVGLEPAMGGLEPRTEQWDPQEVSAFFAGKVVDPGCFNLGGTWMGAQQVGTATLEIWTPLDRWGFRYAQQYELLNLDPTLWGLFPSATSLTLFTGEVVRTSFSGMEWQSVAHGLDASNLIVYTLLIRGTATLTSCSSFDFGGVFAVYGPGQDPFVEEPAFGCYPMSPGTSTRMGTWHGCAPNP